MLKRACFWSLVKDHPEVLSEQLPAQAIADFHETAAYPFFCAPHVVGSRGENKVLARDHRAWPTGDYHPFYLVSYYGGEKPTLENWAAADWVLA